MPPQSTTRRINDNLCPCNQLNPSVPQNVSDVIAAATEYDYSRRTQSVDDMLSGLLQTAEGKTSVYKPQELPEKRQDSQEDSVPERKVYHRSRSALYAVLSMLVTFGVLGYIMLRFIDTSALEPEETSSSSVSVSKAPIAAGPLMEAGNNVPDFIGMSAESIQATAYYTDNYFFSIREEENDEVEEGIVFDQSPAPKAPMQNKGTVVLYVSKGAPMIPMPALAGRTVDEAVQILTASGFSPDSYEIVYSFEDGEDDKVLRTNIAPDTPIRKNKDKIMLIVRSKDMSSSSEPEDEEDPDEESSSSKKNSSSKIVVKPKRSSDD